MAGYANILVAIDLSSESEAILNRASEVAGEKSKLHLVYVQEPMDSVYMGVVPYGPVFVGMDEMEDKLRDELDKKLNGYGDQFGVDADARYFLSGSPAREVRQFADDHDMDLIVLGTHGQKGMQLLLGATANSVLHGACCDVLAVRIYE